jgi:arsenate reductase (glutaredoxin)
MAIHIYHYPKCSTCRKARSFLEQHAIAYTHSDLVAAPIPVTRLRDLVARSGLPITRFFNTAGESYRNGDWKTRIKQLSEKELLAALAQDGKLVKRPILDAGDFVLVGFDQKSYSNRLT